MRRQPLIGISILFAGGIALAKFIAIPFLLLYGLGFLCLTLSFIFSKWQRGTILLYILYFLLGGIFYSNAVTFPANHLSSLNFPANKTVYLKGIVASFPQEKIINKSSKTNFILEVKEARVFDKWVKVSGKALVNSFNTSEFSYADYIILEGRLFSPKNFYLGRNFSYADYLFRQGITRIFSVKKQSFCQILDRDKANFLALISFKAKKVIQGIIRKNLPVPEAGILEAFILGERSNLSRQINNLFVQTGTVHILAISGFNVGIVIFMVLILLKSLRINRKARFLLTILFIIIYAIITGSQPSVVRASIMAVVVLIGILLEREINIYNSLSLAALIILMARPQALWDIGFQLSFISVISIVWLTGKIEEPVLKRLNSKSQVLKWSLRSVSMSLSAWLGIAGVVVYYFSILSPITVLANLFIVPLSSLVVVLGFCLVCTGLVFPALAYIFSTSTKLCLDLLVAGVYLFSKLPAAYFYLKPIPFWVVLGYYLLLIPAFSLIKPASFQQENT